MKIVTFTGGEVETNAYLVVDDATNAALIVDAPHGLAEEILHRARQVRARIAYLVNTHGHWDHIADNAPIVKATGAKLLIHPDDEPLLANPRLMARFGMFFDIEPIKPDAHLKEGEALKLGNLEFEVLHCPGHCRGSVVLYERTEKVAFVGDIIFAASVGRTDLPGGSWDQLLESIETKILSLPDDVKLYPGHGPVTTIGQERRTNPFLQ